MDIEKAICNLKENIEMPFGITISKETSKMIIESLQELQQYRQIGTVDECRATRDELIELQEYLKLGTVNECWEAREKHTPKEPIIKTINGIMCTACPKCFCFSIPESKYCSNCGQALKWGD